tara:strand:+ start:244 stop:594 length:351 start_codon:yes stop_codon:yes gene_type:complete
MIHIVKSSERKLTPFPIEGAQVRVSDPIIATDKELSVGYTEYYAASRLEWVFDYNEAFLMLEGSLEVHADGQIQRFEAGDLGFIEKGTETTIVVAERAYLLHITQPAWSGAEDTTD